MRTLGELSLSEKVGQLFVVPARGNFTNASSAEFVELSRRVEESGVGGVIFFESRVHATAWLCARLQERARVPLLISADLEAGSGMRFPEATWWPPAMAIAATGDPENAARLGAVTAREARAIGIQHVLAPVADVNVDPKNPVINTRSFGEDPHEVARYVEAFIRGVQGEGLLATAKHFPGHGDTATDSHRSLPVLDVTRQRLDEVELVPFRAAIAAEVGSVMIGHLSVPVLDGETVPVRRGHADNPYGTRDDEVPEGATMPATLSEPIVGGVLRRELGYDGLVVTDAFDMGGVVEHFDAGEAAVRAIAAGCDQVLMPADLDAAITGVLRAIADGRLPMSRIDDAAGRVLRTKARLDFGGSNDAAFRIVDAPEHLTLARQIAEDAITLVRGFDRLANGRVGAVIVSDVVEPLPALVELEAQLSARTACLAVRLDARTSAAEAAAMVDRLKQCDRIVLALAIRARSGHGRISIPEPLRAAIADLPAETIAVSFGSPYLIAELPREFGYVCAYGPQPVMQNAVAKALFAEIEMRGVLPVSL